MALKRIGKILSLSIDTTAKTIDVELLLKGEERPLTITIRGYSLCEEGLLIHELRSNREWVEGLFETFFQKRPIPLPKGIQEYLSLFL